MLNATTSLPLPYKQARPWVFFVAGMFFLNFGGRSLLAPLLVPLEAEMALSHAQATSLLLLQGVGFALAQGVSGFLAGILRPARIIGGSTAAGGLCFLCLPFLDGLFAAQVLFLFYGLTAGLYFPAAMAVLGSLVHRQDWGKAVSLHELAPSLSFIVLPPACQAALPFLGLRGIFAAAGVLMLMVGVAFLSFGRGGQQTTEMPSFKGSAEIAHSRAAWALFFLLVVVLTGEFSVFSVLQIYLVGEAGMDAAGAGNLMALSRLATPFAVLAGGWAADKLPAAPTLLLSLLAQALGLTLMCMPQAVPPLVGMSIQALSMAFIFPVLFKAVAERFAVDKQPLLFSLTLPAAALLASGIMPWFFGICGQYFSFGLGFGVLAGLTVASMPAVFTLCRSNEATDPR